MTQEDINCQLEVIDRLRMYQDWRLGADIEQPEPKQLTSDINVAISAFSVFLSREQEKLDKKSNP